MSEHCENKQHTTSAAGNPRLPLSQSVLEAGSSILQDFTPPRQICAHLCAFHTYVSDPSLPPIEVHHYCTHLTTTLRQCLLYDSPSASARLIGVEYMIAPSVYATLPEDERKLWHSHAFEVKSGQLVMPGVPDAAEMKEMREVVGWYGKTWHMWRVERGDEVPLGRPELMGSYTAMTPALERALERRDGAMGEEGLTARKREARRGIEEPVIHEDVDSWVQK
ncbi:hypothetical protein EDC01DRAFT_690521 [Geopyxis carbonaria]|nr:hypothetical protein EDC01DRAFT_690521 [Geopyxis carbonaria]